MNLAQPIIHQLTADDDPAALVTELTGPQRERAEPGMHVVVLVTDARNDAYARIVDPASPGNGSQRWLHHARRGASPGGWSEQHHPRSEKHIGAWKNEHASDLDRLLISCSKQAWKLDATAPYVVEFPVRALEA